MFLQFLLTHQFTKLGIFLRESWEFNTSGYCWLYVIYLFFFLQIWHVYRQKNVVFFNTFNLNGEISYISAQTEVLRRQTETFYKERNNLIFCI